MPRYKVLIKGFFGGRLYDPEGKRRILHTEEPFPSKDKVEQVPKWLEALKSETSADAKSRKAADAKTAKTAKQKHKDDQKEISDASFLGEGENNKTVETL